MISLCALSIVCAVCMWVANARAIVGALVNEIRALKLIFVCDFTSCRCKVLATKLDTTVFVLLFFFVPPKIKAIIIIFVSCCDTWSPSKNNNTHTHTVCACNCFNANATDETRRDEQTGFELFDKNQSFERVSSHDVSTDAQPPIVNYDQFTWQ